MATLIELKMRKMELRDKMDKERREGGSISEETGIEYGQLIDRLQEGERKLYKPIKWPVIVLLLAITTAFSLGGCTSSATLGVSSSVYYPKRWESPASRKQHTQPTVGMARNNLPMVGGAK